MALSVFNLYPLRIKGYRHLQVDMTVSSQDSGFTGLIVGAAFSALTYSVGIPAIAIVILIRKRREVSPAVVVPLVCQVLCCGVPGQRVCVLTSRSFTRKTSSGFCMMVTMPSVGASFGRVLSSRAKLL
jgi:hypothetical protein